MAAHLESAKEQLETFAIVGLTERYRETLILCEAVLGMPLGRPEYLNLSQLPSKHWSSEMTEKIEDLNRYDTELYRFAEQIFERHLQEMMADS